MYRRGLGYHHKQVFKQSRGKNEHGYKMNSGSGVFDSINEITEPIIDLVSNNKDTIKYVAETAINAVRV